MIEPHDQHIFDEREDRRDKAEQRALSCKYHKGAHEYMICPRCRHQYCPHYWRECPQCEPDAEISEQPTTTKGQTE